MLYHQLNLLTHFYRKETDLAGNPIDWNQYEFVTMQELDRLRAEIGSRCKLIRGNHGLMKETAVDFYYPDAKYHSVVMALMRSGFSKGFYQGGSVHIDHVMGPTGLARCWMAFRKTQEEELKSRGFWHLYSYTADNWLYFKWGDDASFSLLNYLVEINT